MVALPLMETPTPILTINVAGGPTLKPIRAAQQGQPGAIQEGRQQTAITAGAILLSSTTVQIRGAIRIPILEAATSIAEAVAGAAAVVEQVLVVAGLLPLEQGADGIKKEKKIYLSFLLHLIYIFRFSFPVYLFHLSPEF